MAFLHQTNDEIKGGERRSKDERAPTQRSAVTNSATGLRQQLRQSSGVIQRARLHFIIIIRQSHKRSKERSRGGREARRNEADG